MGSRNPEGADTRLNLNTSTPAGTEEGGGRRRFLFRAGWGFLATFLLGGLGSTVRFLIPPEDPRNLDLVDAGEPEDFPRDTVTYVEDGRIFVFNSEGGFHAISAACTHLGCTINWVQERGRFECPCHGSVFSADGEVIQGPAPRALDWYELKLEQGRLVVNKSKIVRPGFHFQI